MTAVSKPFKDRSMYGILKPLESPYRIVHSAGKKNNKTAGYQLILQRKLHPGHELQGEPDPLPELPEPQTMRFSEYS